MKRLLLLSTLSVLAAPTYAADVIIAEPVPVIVEPDTFSWTGGYIGVNAGYAGGKFKHPFSAYENENPVIPVSAPAIANLAAFPELDNLDRFNGSADITASGFVGGVQAGYNWQFDNNVIAGVEADFQGSNLKGEAKLRANDFDIKAGTKVNWYGTLRARLGYTPVDRFMVYATGGYAYGKVNSYIDIDGKDASKSNTKSGWTVGAGAEYAITNNWTLKTEYLYTDLGKTKLINYNDDIGGVKLDTKVNFHTVRAGINYKF